MRRFAGGRPDDYSFSMAKPGSRSILYRLIEAGQLARRALLVPLNEHGLEPGDDALLFFLHEQVSATEADLAAAFDAEPMALRHRIARLCDRELVARQVTRTDLPSRLALTESGDRVRARLAGYWDELETALTAELSPKRRRRLRRTLGRFSMLLRR